MRKLTMGLTVLWVISVGVAGAANGQAAQEHAGHHTAQKAAKTTKKTVKGSMCEQCSMCKEMMGGAKAKSGMMGGMGMMGGSQGKGGMMGGMSGMGSMQPKGGMMGGMMGMGGAPAAAGPAAITVANDGMIYVLRSDVLYKFSTDMKLIGSVPMPAAGATGQGHEGHH